MHSTNPRTTFIIFILETADFAEISKYHSYNQAIIILKLYEHIRKRRHHKSKKKYFKAYNIKYVNKLLLNLDDNIEQK